MTEYLPRQEKPKFIVPAEASRRGRILKGTVTSKHHIYPDVLVQFSEIGQRSRRARIYLYPTVEQAERLRHDDSPFAFDGQLLSREGVVEHWKASEIWMNGISEFFYTELTGISQPWGDVHELSRTTTAEDIREHRGTGRGWFVANTSIALQLLATEAESPQQGRPQFNLSEGAIAYVTKIVARHWHVGEEERLRRAYVIQAENVTNSQVAKRDVDGLLIVHGQPERTAEASRLAGCAIQR